MTWIVRRFSPRSIRPNAHGALALVTLLAMSAAALMPGGEPANEAHALSPNGKAATSAQLDGASTEERNGARPAPLGRDRSDRHAEHPAPAGQPIEVPGLVAEHDGQAALRVPDEAVVDTAPAPETPKAEAREQPKPKPKTEAAPPPAPAFPQGPSRLFARHDGMHLYTPSADPIRIGFHEAAYGTAVGMIPLGRALANDNMGKYHLPPLTPTDQQYLVLSSRGRPHHATSAADIVMRPGEPVRAVVTGMVVEAKPYMLYGMYPDAMIRIRSAEDNGKIVTMLHVTGLRVRVGQQILAGETIVADTATSFPFLSQIDYYLGGKPHPHVHVEVKRG